MAEVMATQTDSGHKSESGLNRCTPFANSHQCSRRLRAVRIFDTEAAVGAKDCE